MVLTYSGLERDGKTVTQGGYSNQIVVDENFVLKVSDKLPLERVAPLLFQRRRVVGSLIGGLPETQEMLDYCAEKNITSDIELIDIRQINEAYVRMEKSDVKYRFVIDMATL